MRYRPQKNTEESIGTGRLVGIAIMYSGRKGLYRTEVYDNVTQGAYVYVLKPKVPKVSVQSRKNGS